MIFVSHMNMLKSCTPGDLGFDIGPGQENNSVIVTSLNPGSVAFEKLR
jgi:hypothetical protein